MGTVFLGPYLGLLAREAADAAGRVYLLGIPIAPDSFFTYCVSFSVLLQVVFLPILGAIADYFAIPENQTVSAANLSDVSISGTNTWTVAPQGDGYIVTVTDGSGRCPRFDSVTKSL